MTSIVDSHVVPSGASATPALALSGASKRFGAVTALEDISLDVRHGEVLALLGDNGAGKSTLIKCISGVHRLDGGEIEIDGDPVSLHTPADARAARHRDRLPGPGAVRQPAPADNFYAGRELAGPSWVPRGRCGSSSASEMDQRRSDVLDRLQVGLPDFDATVALMSGGQRQAVAVARATVFARKVVILDEPTAALGAAGVARGSCSTWSRGSERAGNAVILITHNMEHVMELADRAVVLRRRRKVDDPVHGDLRADRLADGRGVVVQRTLRTSAALSSTLTRSTPLRYCRAAEATSMLIQVPMSILYASERIARCGGTGWL